MRPLTALALLCLLLLLSAALVTSADRDRTSKKKGGQNQRPAKPFISSTPPPSSPASLTSVPSSKVKLNRPTPATAANLTHPSTDSPAVNSTAAPNATEPTRTPPHSPRSSAKGSQTLINLTSPLLNASVPSPIPNVTVPSSAISVTSATESTSRRKSPPSRPTASNRGLPPTSAPPPPPPPPPAQTDEEESTQEESTEEDESTTGDEEEVSTQDVGTEATPNADLTPSNSTIQNQTDATPVDEPPTSDPQETTDPTDATTGETDPTETEVTDDPPEDDDTEETPEDSEDDPTTEPTSDDEGKGEDETVDSAITAGVNASSVLNASTCSNCSSDPSYMSDDTTERFNVSMLLIGNDFLAAHDLPSILLPSLFDASGLTHHIDTALQPNYPLFSTSPSRLSHSSTSSPTRAILSTHMYHHIIVQDSLTHPFYPHLRPAYITQLTSLWNLTCPMTHLHLLSPPLPCPTPSASCLHDEEEGEVEGYEDGQMLYGDVLDQWTGLWFKEVEQGMKGAMAGKNRSMRVDVVPLGSVFVPQTEEEEETWLGELYDSEREGEAVLSLKGSYLTACLIFAVTTGRTPVGAPAPSVLTEEGIDEEEVLLIQMRVAEALSKWWRFSDRRLAALNGSMAEMEEEVPAPSTVAAPSSGPANSTESPTSTPSTDDDNPDYTPEHRAAMEKQRQIEEYNQRETEKKARLEALQAKTANSTSKSGKLGGDSTEAESSDEDAEETRNEEERNLEPPPPVTPHQNEVGGSDPWEDPSTSASESSSEPTEVVQDSTPTYTDTLTAIPFITVLYALLGVTVLAALWWLCTCAKSLWIQSQLRRRRGYDDGEAGEFIKRSTEGYAFDDGL